MITLQRIEEAKQILEKEGINPEEKFVEHSDNYPIILTDPKTRCKYFFLENKHKDLYYDGYDCPCHNVTTNQSSTDKGMEYEPMLAATADSLRKFVWVGWNRHFKQYWVSEPLTTRQLLESKYPSFFNVNNDNCIFVMEIFEGDTLIYYSQNSMSSISVKIENGVFVGEGPFNTHPLEGYFNATDFVNMER